MRLTALPRSVIVVLAVAFSLAACEKAPPAENPEPSAGATGMPGPTVAPVEVSPLPTVSPAMETATGAPAPLPSATTANGDPAVEDPHQIMPSPLTADAQKGEKGARNVLLSFIRAIELGDLRVAYALTDPGYREQHSEADFRTMFDGLGRITVAAPTGRMEGAAGSSYYSVPVTVSGSTGSKLNGIIALRRVNDVPGATPYQLNWHVSSVDLKPVG